MHSPLDPQLSISLGPRSTDPTRNCCDQHGCVAGQSVTPQSSREFDSWGHAGEGQSRGWVALVNEQEAGGGRTARWKPEVRASHYAKNMSEEMILAVDCGGGGIKASVLDSRGTLTASPVRTPTPYPLPPELLVKTTQDLAAQLPAATRVTMGMPGMLRHGVVITTPHYITRDGPRSRILPELVEQWTNFDMGRALEAALGMPTLVLNDAEVAGAGVITGTGLEMIVTLGTGLGNAVFDSGVLAPHVEVSQGFVRWGLTYDDYIGEHERLRLGDAHWSRRVRRVIDGLRPMYVWDRLYLGGGNSKRVTAMNRAKLGDDVVIVPNDAGIIGGVRAWTL